MLGVSGSIAAVEAPRIARELIRHGADVIPVMSGEATRIVSPEAMQFATGHPPVLALSGDVEHVTLLGPGEGRADLLLIAPATANTISKIAHGIDDTPVTSCASIALGGGVPILLAPAMHGHMGLNPAVQENLRRLTEWGVGIIPAVSIEGEEKIPSPEAVAAAVLHRLGRPPWLGRRVVVIGGASREPIDRVRSITNESSGETAIALATEAHFRGADVELWAGATYRPPPELFPVVRWTTVGDLIARVRSASARLRRADAVIVPAALSDFTVEPRPGKISSKDPGSLTLRLGLAPKVLPELRKTLGRSPILVGFKLEAGVGPAELVQRATELRQGAELDAVVANDASALGAERVEVLWMDRLGTQRWLAGTKREVAGGILDALAPLLPHATPATRARRTPSNPHRRTRARRSPRRRTAASPTS